MLRVAQHYGKSGVRINKPVIKPEENRLFPKIAYLPSNTKLLAWGIFLIFFIEAGTLGLIPKNYYFVYRNVKVSDILMYYLIFYSFLSLKEFTELFRSRSFLIVKLLLTYAVFQFLISCIQYKVNVLEYFFRLKPLWMSLMIFPYFLLLKRGGFEYFVKLVIPVAIISNVFYIFTSLTGVSLYPEISMVQQDLPGGLKVFRVFGGTFFGEYFFLGLIFYWNEFKFRLIHIPFILLFALPHVLAFGRNAWLFFTFAIIFIIIWSSYRRQNFTAMIRQSFLIFLLVSSFMYFFSSFVPQAEDLSDAIEARIQQGRDDVKYTEGTYGTRMANRNALIKLWSENPILGVGMHPMWVIKGETSEEDVYAWGFADIRWAGVLAAYGAIGFLIALIFQLYYMIISVKLLKKITIVNINYYFLLLFLIYMIRDLFINYVYYLTTVSLSILGPITSFFVANLVYLYEKNYGNNPDKNDIKTV